MSPTFVPKKKFPNYTQISLSMMQHGSKTFLSACKSKQQIQTIQKKMSRDMNEQKDIVFENQTEFRIDELKKHLTNWLN